MVIVSPPGKLMVMGEHAVVYGPPCIVTAVDRRLVVTAQDDTGESDVIEAPQVTDTRFIRRALHDTKVAFGSRRSVRLLTESSFSNSYGFGSSSAVVAATIRAICALFGQTIEKRRLFDMAYRIVLSVQGVGSGFDVAAAVYGGSLYFRTGGAEITPLANGIPL